MKNILVTGGAGYIGSFMVKRLLDEGYFVVVIDNLARGHLDSVDKRAVFWKGDITEVKFLDDVFSKYQFDSVIHFAGYIAVGESMLDPDSYFRNNTLGSFLLIEHMRKHGVNNIIFSSSAGVYGNPVKLPISEDHPKKPESPYGESKLLVENGLEWYSRMFGIHAASLRYFNASGAALDGSMGEQHVLESHLIPNLIQAVLSDTQFTLFGDDYPTNDGTCIRDYIHVLDLVEAHLLALNKIMNENGNFVYNVGTGTGYSNKEIMTMVENVTAKKIAVNIKPRRPGDPSVLIADNSKIIKELMFAPQYSDLTVIIESAWRWHEANFKK